MVRKRITRSIDELPDTRSTKRKKVEDPCESTAKVSSKSKRISSPRCTTPARKRKPKSEQKSEPNGYASEPDNSEVEVSVKKKQRVSRRTNMKNTRPSNEEKPDEVEKTKGQTTTRKRGKKGIQKQNEKSCLQSTDGTTCIDTDVAVPMDIEISSPKVKAEILEKNVTPSNKHARRKNTRNPKKSKKILNESTEDMKSKLDDQFNALSRVSEWVKTEKNENDDSSGGESEEDIDWEDVQEAEGHHSMDLCDNSSISSSMAHSSPMTKTENKNVEISIQIPGMKGKRKKKPEDDLLTKIQKAMARFKKQIQLDMHKVHLVSLVAWGFNRNAVCNQPVLQAYCLSYVPSHLITKSVKKWQSEELTNIITWFKEEFPPLQQFRDDLSKNHVIPISSYPGSMAEVLVILLRSLGILTRLVSSLQPVSMKISKNGKAASKKLNASKNIPSPSNSSIQETPARAEKLNDMLQSENTADDSENVDSKQANANSPTSSTSTSVPSSSPSSSGQAKVKTIPSTTPSASSQSKVKSSVNKTSKQNEKPRTTKSFTAKVESKSEKNENGQEEVSSGPKRKRLRKHKKVNYADNKDSGSDIEEQESSYSEEKSNYSESDEEFEKEISYKAPVKKLVPSKGKKRKTSPTSKSKKSPSVVEMIDDDNEFEVTSKPRIFRRQSSQSSKEGKSPVQIISDDSDEGVTLKKNKAGTDMWVEVYLQTSKSWWCIDLVSYSINQPEMCEENASKQLSYVLSFDNENSVKDVTERYASDWLSKTKKFRIDAEWWEETLLPYKTRKRKMDEMENSQLLAQHQEKPLPQSVTEYKNHPLYVLKRHLLKFEAIYPETAATLGFIRGEAVYSRDCVHLLHTREKWMSLDGRVVKQGEEPYKIVKGRMKRNQPVVDPSTVTIDLFGRWQTEEYKPPPVKDGKVPRNEYGNVELFKPSMLPPGSKHIKIPGIQKIAKKLGIDGAPAVVGFDFHCGFCHPVIDGLVVAKESVPALMDAWRQEQDAAEKRKEEKREKRVLGHWKLFVKSIMIRERLKRKYDTQESRTSSEQNGEQLEDEKISSVAVSWPQNMKQGKTSVRDEGHCHVFPKKLHKKDKITGEWTKSCSCGVTLPLDK